MPNHTSCVLKVVGSRKALNAFKEKAKISGKNEEGEETNIIFSFESLLPMPPELRNSTSPVRIVSQAEYDQAVKDREKALVENPKSGWLYSLPLTAEMQHDLLKKFGFDNWYDWATTTWGTKWGVYDVSEAWEEGPYKNEGQLPLGEFVGDLTPVTLPDFQITCHFQSAWAPPSEGILHISELFPDLMFICGYADEGGGYLGYSIFSKGVEQETMLPHHPWDGDAQKEFRALCGQPIYEDEDEEETAQLPESTN
jgi:hypothetical protein